MSAGLIQGLSLVGALLVLAAYGGQQYASLRNDGLGYGLMNLVGSLLLAGSAIRPFNGGVVLVEAAWAVLSLAIVYRALARKPNSTPGQGAPPDVGG